MLSSRATGRIDVHPEHSTRREGLAILSTNGELVDEVT